LPLFSINCRKNGIGAELSIFAANKGIGEHIRWLGARSDIADLLSASDIGILASHEEGFSNAIIEGMAAGLPMVVTDVGGNAEAVGDRETGLVVPARHPIAMGKALLELAVNAELRKTMGLNAKQRVAEHFTLKKCVQRYEILYEALAAGQTPLRQPNKEIRLPAIKKP
jgi:glycosyltransferase involved in cell wall biosynthesis